MSKSSLKASLLRHNKLPLVAIEDEAQRFALGGDANANVVSAYLNHPEAKKDIIKKIAMNRQGSAVDDAISNTKLDASDLHQVIKNRIARQGEYGYANLSMHVLKDHPNLDNSHMEFIIKSPHVSQYEKNMLRHSDSISSENIKNLYQGNNNSHANRQGIGKYNPENETLMYHPNVDLEWLRKLSFQSPDEKERSHASEAYDLMSREKTKAHEKANTNFNFNN